MPTDLNILKKAFQNATATYEAAKPWDEPLDRRESVEVDQTFAAPVVPGDVGGWVASGGYPYQSVEYSLLAESAQEGAVPPSQTYHETYPGREGYNDVDFVPYNWGTNRFGSKGGALLGHPISWEVVGPTSKSPFLHWQWAVGGALNNTLTLEPGVLTASGGYGTPNVEQAYNLSATGISVYNGGLYVLVTLTGDEVSGMLTVGSNGLTPTNPSTFRFELFRVTKYIGQTIVLEPSKLLSSYFTIPGSPKIRSITLLRPKVTRLAGFPLSLNGTTQRNQVFAFLPPESAAVSEYMPPYDGGALCPDWSVTGTFDDAVSIPTGATADYGTPNLLPIPAPVFQTYGYVTTAPLSAARWNLQLILTGTDTIAVGQVVRVQATTRSTLTDDGVAQTFGWFEAVTNLTVSGVITLRRVPEVNSSTGAVFYGNGPVSAVALDTVIVEVYDNIGTIFTDPVLSISKIVAARLDHLIDPSAEGTSFRNYGSTNPARLGTPPSPAIFDTVTNSKNPGNLSDLGFRVVLFPAKFFGGVIAPDFDNPITGNRVVLDPTLPATTEQYLEVDYSAGVLYLSHPPVPGAGCAVAPTGIIPDAVNNPRNEVVLYAACVPYSREPSQRGGGVRVTTTPTGGAFGLHDSADIYGQRVVLELSEPVGTIITDGSNFNIAGDATKFPARTGWFRFGEVDPVTGAFTLLSPLYYYPYGVISFSTNYFVTTVAMGGVSYTTTADTRVVFLKSPANIYNPSSKDSDAVRGSSKRFDRINFRGGRTEVSVDGSLTLTAGSTTLDEAYRAGDPFTPGAGRVITVDGAAVEARPDAAAITDAFKSSFRVSVADGAGAKSLTGFDFKSDAFTLAIQDPYAGFSDRRVFAPASATSTTLLPSFTVDVNVATVTATAGEFFWFAGSYHSTLLIFGHDLIEIEGVTYIIAGYGADEYKVLILNLDGTAPVLSLTGVQATVYRPRLLTGRGSTGTPADNLNTWITAQEQSEASVGQPYGALNLYAGSATAIAPGDGGGSTAALAFWSRVATSGGSPQEALFSTMYFDTMGRLVSTLNPDFMQGGNLPDYTYRGDFATRAVKDTIFPAAPAFGHIVEEYTDVQARYDYLSLVPLIPGGATYNATVSNVLTGEVTVTSVLLANLIPYGSAIFELTSVNGITTKRGLFLITSGDDISVSPNTYFWLRDLNGTVGTLALAPLLVVNTDTLTFRLHFSTSIGKRKDTLYLDTALAAVSHTASQSLGVGIETNAVGLVISAPARYVGALNEDRHAYRVTTASTPGSAASPSNIETAALDVEGFHKANDYLYLSSRTITKQINTQLFQPIDTAIRWDFDDANGWWDSNGNSHIIKIPLDLPRSSDRTDSAGAKTHRTRLTSIAVKGQFHGGVGNEAIVRIYRVTLTGLPPTRTQLYLGPALAVGDYLLPSAGANTTTLIAVWEDAAATLPVYIDDTTSTYYYIEVVSASSIGGSDLLYGVQVTYTDPGPRNY